MAYHLHRASRVGKPNINLFSCVHWSAYFDDRIPYCLLDVWMEGYSYTFNQLSNIDIRQKVQRIMHGLCMEM